MTGQWVERRRADFADLRIRTLQCSASVNLAISSFRAGARDAQRAVDADPLRESSWWLLMNAHAGTGDLASAIAAYERCRSTLARELGSTPSRQHASDTPQSSPEPATTHSRRQARHNVGLRKSRIRQNQSPSPADPAARTAGPSRSSGRYTDLNLASEAALIARLGAGRTTYLRQS
jgi:DNA-binding SARP family transcriptional activator